MRNALSIFTAFCIGTALVGCNSNSNPPAPSPVNPPTPTEEPHGTLGWTLKLQSKCPNNAEEQCLAEYGFSVLNDGHFIVGPGPQGELRNGTLSPEDQSSLSTALASTLTGTKLEAASHQSIDAGESNDTVTLSRGTNEAETLIRTEGADLSYQTPSAEDAKILLTAIRTLAVKYYVMPFPDACGDGANTLQALFSSMQTCATDSDCVYLESFEPIESNSTQSLTLDDCSMVRPMVVGNASSVRMNKAKLEELLIQVQTACGQTTRPDCTEVKELKLTGAAPVCRQGSCQAPNQ